MRCTKSRKNISLALDGMLPNEDTLAMEEHLALCADCRGYRDELLMGSRILRATAAEPSDAFEWKLQLKLNQALQEAAAARTPWEEPARGSRFGWLRGFGLSAGAGLAAVVALSLWVFPQGAALVTEDPIVASPTTLAQSQDAPATAGVGTTAGNADRRALSGTFQPLSGLQRGLVGSLVSSGGVFGDAASGGATPWDRSVNARSLSTLQSEIAWLRNQLRTTQAANDSLRALLAGQAVGYLEGENAANP